MGLKESIFLPSNHRNGIITIKLLQKNITIKETGETMSNMISSGWIYSCPENNKCLDTRQDDYNKGIYFSGSLVNNHAR